MNRQSNPQEKENDKEAEKEQEEDKVAEKEQKDDQVAQKEQEDDEESQKDQVDEKETQKEKEVAEIEFIHFKDHKKYFLEFVGSTGIELNYSIVSAMKDIKGNDIAKLKSLLFSNISDENHWNDYWNKVTLNTRTLIAFIIENNPKIIEEFIEHNPIDSSAICEQGDNLTVILINNGWVNALDYIVKQGCDFKIKSAEGKNLLYVAAQQSINSDCFNYLLSLNCQELDLNELDSNNNTLLHLAVQCNRLESVKLLLQQKNIDISIRNSTGLTAYDLINNADIIIAFNEYLKQQKQAEEQSNGIGICDLYSKYVFRGMCRGGRTDHVNHLLKRNSQTKKVRDMIINTNNNYDQNLINVKQFKLVRQLGTGGFGEVNLVQSSVNQQFHALKIMNKQLIKSRFAEKYVLRERDTLCKIRSLNYVCQLHFAFQDQQFLYLGMEFIEGEDLSKLLFREDRIKEQQAKLYISELVYTMAALHSKGIIYRDLKPENILIDKEGHIKLVDFGLVATNITHKNKAMSFCGTAAYLSPEMIGKKGHSFPADWYGVGVVSYELMTGQNPFEGNDMNRVINNVLNKRLNKPSYISFDAWDFLTSLMSKDPRSRLGGNSSEEVMKHKWLKDINWEHVKEKKLKMPQYDWMKTRSSIFSNLEERNNTGGRKNTREAAVKEFSYEEMAIDQSSGSEQSREPQFTENNSTSPYYYNWNFL